MNIVIVEDENLASEKLERYLLKYDASIKVIKVLVSIKDAVSWFLDHNDYDLVFLDIQLTDGLSFEIFNKIKLKKPLIFTTAFDEYAIDAFKVNSIDYILKPITFTDLSKAMNKLKKMQTMFTPQEVVKKVADEFTKKKIKDRFLIRLGNHLYSKKTSEISLFFADGRTVYLITNDNKKYILDYKLETLDSILDANMFFRVNRSFIISIHTIDEVIMYSSSRLKISPKVLIDKEIIVSRDKVSLFKKWFEGN